MEQVSVVNIVISLITIAVNIFITAVNRGKNRNIYEIKSFFTGSVRMKMK